MNAARPLNRETVQQRLVMIRQMLNHLGELQGVSAQELQDDWMKRSALERIVMQLVELASQINTHIVSSLGAIPPHEYRATFLAAAEAGVLSKDLADRLAPSAGLRNVLVHQYVDADLTIVAAAVDDALRDYDEYTRTIARWLQQ